MFILSEVGKESKLYEYDLYLYTQFLVHNNQYYLCIYFHFLTVDYTIRLFIFSLIFFVYVQGRSILYPITVWIVKIYKYIYILLCSLCIYFYTKKYDYKLYLYIITEVAQIWSRVFSVLRFILGCMTCRDLAWNTTQKYSHKWSHLIRYGWCDEFISFVTLFVGISNSAILNDRI